MYENLKDKNLLLLHTTLRVGGAQKVLVNIANGVFEHFNKVFLAANLSEAFYLYEIHPQIEVINIKTRSKNFFVQNFYLFILFPYKLFRIIKKFKIDVVHLHHRSLSFGAYWVTKLLNVRYVATSHNVFFDKYHFTFWGKRIIAVSNKVKENLINYFKIDPRNITVIYNGIKPIDTIDKDKIRKIKKEINFDSKKNYVGFIGLFNKQKGHEIFLQAVKKNEEKFSDVEFLLIGEGEREEFIKKECNRLKICDKVKFLGKRKEIPEFIHLFSFLVLSSYWEGFPIIILESFSCKKTFVATNVGGVSEIIKDGYNGFLVEAGNSEALSERMLRLIENKELLKQFSKNAFETYNENFTLEKFIEDHLKFYYRIFL